MWSKSDGRPHGIWMAAGLIALAMVVSGCGTGSTAAAGSAGTAGSQDPSVGADSAPSPAAAGSASVGTADGAIGTYLTDAKGVALYLWVKDDKGQSQCSGSCAAVWPALTTSGTPSATGGAEQSMLGSIPRPDGSTQVTYDGWPLYYYASDSASGQTTGQGSDGFGAKWWLVDPAGSALTGTGGSPAAASTGGGYQYGG